MSVAALAIEFLFQAAGWIPRERRARIVEAGVTLNYTTILNAIFLIIAALLLLRFLRDRRAGDAPAHEVKIVQAARRGLSAGSRAASFDIAG